MDTSEELLICQHCGETLNVTDIAPHSLVECLHCKGFTRTSSKVGKYTITTRLGVGGMSYVYRAQDDVLGRDIALKVLNDTYSKDPERIKSLTKEAQVMALVSNPHVVKVYGVGSFQGSFYIAMELVEGSNLEAKIVESVEKGYLIDEAECIQIAREIVEGLDAAYQVGLLHRDIKPANILLNTLGQAQIVDFGLSTMTSQEEEAGEEIWVTPHYAPPETLERKPEDVRSDIYALCATLYQLFTGQPPITTKSTSVITLLNLKRDSVKPVGELRPGLSEKVCYAIDRGIKFNKEDRFDSYTEIATLLREAQNELSNPKHITWQKKKLREKRDRYFKLVRNVGGGVVALILAVGLLYWILKEKPVEEIKDTIVDTTEVSHDNPPTDVDAGVDRRKSSLRVSELYSKGKDFFVAQKYKDALDSYALMFSEANAPKITLAWVSLDAYATLSLLNADKLECDKIINHILSILEKEKLLTDKEFEPLVTWFKRMQSEEALTEAEAIQLSRIYTPTLFLVALKYWQKGDFDKAKALFNLKDKINFKEGEESWKVFYEARVAECLNDLKLWDSFHRMPEKNISEIEKKIKQLNDSLDLVKTSSVQALFKMPKLELPIRLEHARELEQLAQEKAKRTMEENVKVSSFVKLKDYDKALFELGVPQSDEEALLNDILEKARRVYIYASLYFLSKEEPTLLTLTNGDKVQFCDLMGNTLIVKKGEVDLKKSWGDIDPKSISALLTEVEKMIPQKPEDQLKFNLTRWAYALLNGNEEDIKKIESILNSMGGDLGAELSKKRAAWKVSPLNPSKA